MSTSSSSAPTAAGAAAADADDTLLTLNPYASNPSLTPLEGEVLWEYAKTARLVKKLATLSKELGGKPNEELLAQLRVLERKMGLVLTLFKASVWAVIVEGEEAEAEMMAKQEERERAGEQTITGGGGGGDGTRW